jgi:hypothetical protein
MKLLKEYTVKEWLLAIALIALLTIDWSKLLGA